MYRFDSSLVRFEDQAVTCNTVAAFFITSLTISLTFEFHILSGILFPLGGEVPEIRLFRG